MYYNLIMLFECTCSNIGTARLYKNATQSTFKCILINFVLIIKIISRHIYVSFV
jgi:hypothetical protein